MEDMEDMEGTEGMRTTKRLSRINGMVYYGVDLTMVAVVSMAYFSLTPNVVTFIFGVFGVLVDVID